MYSRRILRRGRSLRTITRCKQSRRMDPITRSQKRILPWRARRRNNFLDTQASDSSLNLFTINRIPITQKIAGSRVERKSLHQLLRCHIEVRDPPAIMAEHDEHIENAKCGSRDDEEINPGYTVGMVFEKRPPGLRRWFSLANHILRNCGLRDLYTKLE